MRATRWLIVTGIVLVTALGTEVSAQGPNVTYHYPQQRYVRPAQPSFWDRISGHGASNDMRQLPYSRRYYNGRYYGPFNDRFYGPQYGNF